MSYLFGESIASWSDWGRVFQSIPAFEPMVREILRREQLPDAPIENLTPGTNAVFKVGGYVIKIFCPAESGLDGAADMATEVFATRLAHSLGVAAPDVVATGKFSDRYDFAYLVMDFLGGVEMDRALPTLSRERKLRLGAEARRLIDRMNVPCENFNGVDVLRDPDRSERWAPYPESFRRERQEYVDSRDWGEFVFVHGDLTGENVLVDGDRLVVLDFADAVVAPRCYELAPLVFELFRCDRDLLDGFLGGGDPLSIADALVDGLMIHDFGGDIARQRICAPDSLRSLDDLRKAVAAKLRGRV